MEREDEGACWLFQLSDRELLLLAGQEYYATARFPADDFSVVQILGQDDEPFDQLIEVHGKRLTPSVRFPAALRASLPVAEGISVMAGSINELPTAQSAVGSKEPHNEELQQTRR